jgi:shikimate kinase
MGAGKTSVGQALAELLRWSFIDLDEEIERWMKMPIRDIFRLHGESQFREIETKTLRRMLDEASAPTVISLGGGTFVQEANTRLLQAVGARVAFLETPIDEMLQRCRAGTLPAVGNLRPLAVDPGAFRAL